MALLSHPDVSVGPGETPATCRGMEEAWPTLGCTLQKRGKSRTTAMMTITAVYGPRNVLCFCVRPALSDHDRGVADFGEPDRTSHISKMVLSIVKFGGPKRTVRSTVFELEVSL